MDTDKDSKEKILIAVDLSDNSLKAVDYVGRMASCTPDVEVTMLHVIREPSPDIMPDADERAEYVGKVHKETLALMEKAAQRLTSRGMDEKRITLKIQICKKPVSVAELVLHEQQVGDYHTVVVGRRGMSKKEEFLFGSISSKIVRSARHCTVWVVE